MARAGRPRGAPGGGGGRARPPGVQNGGEGESLDRRSGLEGPGDGLVLSAGEHLPRVVAGCGGHGQDLAGCRAAEDDHPAGRVGLAHLGCQDASCLELEHPVDGEPQIGTVDSEHRLADPAGHAAATRIHLAQLRTVAGGQQVVVEQFDAGDACVVGAHRTHDLHGEVAQRVRPVQFRNRAHPLQPQLVHARGLLGWYLPLQVDELARHRHLLGQRLHLGTEGGGQGACHGERVADPGRIRVDRRPLHRRRQRLTGAVQDVAAHANHGALLQAVVPGPGQDLIVLTELKLESPRHEPGGHRQHRQHEHRPAATRPVARRPGDGSPARDVRAATVGSAHGAGGMAGSR